MKLLRLSVFARRSALAEFSLRALSETDVEGLLQAAAESAARALGADFASALELVPDGSALRFVAGYGWTHLPERPTVFALDSGLPAAEAVRTGRPVLLRSGASRGLPPDSPLRRWRVRSSAAVVIESAGQPFGALVVHSRGVGGFARGDLPFLRSLANIAAVAIARERANAQVRGLAHIVESCQDAIFSRAIEGTVTTWNAACERLYGYPADEIVGRTLGPLLPQDWEWQLADLEARLARGEVVQHFQTVRLHKDGTRLEVEATISPILDETGRVASISVISRPIGEEKRRQAEMERLLAAEQAARAEAEQAGERLAFLAEASELLAESLDVGRTVTALADLTVPKLADWCIVYARAEDGGLVRRAVATANPELKEMAKALEGARAPVAEANVFARVLEGESLLQEEVDDAFLVRTVGDDREALERWRRAGLRSGVLVPLRARGRIIGALCLMSAESGRVYSAEDLRLTEELARRAALAVDNAELYRQAQRELDRRRQAEEALRASEERYRLLFEANPNPMWFFNTETLQFLAVNDAAVRTYGYSREEFLSMRSLDIRSEEDVAAHLESIRHAAANGDIANVGVWRHRRKDGGTIHVEVTRQPLEFDGQPAQVVLALDVSERVAAEEALRASEERYRLLFEGNPNPMWFFSTETFRFLAVNEAAIQKYGYSRDEFLSMRSFDIRPQEEVQAHVDSVRRVNRVGGLASAGIFRHIRKDGSVIHVAITAQPVEFDGQPAQVVLAVDESERLAAEQAVREAEQRYRTLVEGLPLVTFTHEPTFEARTTYISPQVEPLLGYGPDEWLADPDLFLELLHPDDRESVLRTRRAGMKETQLSEFRLRAREGRDVWIYSKRRLVRDDDGKPLYVQGFWLDVSEKRRAEAALQESQELYRLVVENTRDMIGLFDPDGRYIFASPSHATVLGYTPEELLGKAAIDLRHPDDAATVSAIARDPRVGAGGIATMHRLRHRDGGYVHVEGFASPIYNADGSLRMILATGRDISDRLRAEELAEQLRQSQKMEAIGRLAGGIAHDFNNLLTVITGYSELARLRTDAPELHEAIDQITAAAKTGSALTGQLLAFTRQQVVQPRVLDPVGSIRNAEGLVDRLIGEDVRLELDLEPGLAWIRADPTQLEQVLLNLAANAREAMPQGGLLRIEARNALVDGDSEQLYVGLAPGRYVVFAVTDTGVGMDEETRSRIFEPFFTTKLDGTGLGLATVHGIVVQNGGHVVVDSEPDVGTTFRLVFPAVAAPVEQPAEAEPAEPELGGSQTVLVVEDEERVRGLATEVLSGHGYTVLAAATPEEALELAAGWTKPLHLVLSDVMLPGIRGPRLVEELQNLHPESRTIYTSGYAPALISERGLQSEQPFLAKPFTASALAAKVREVLAA